MTSLVYSPDGTKLAVATEGNLQIWNLRLLREQLRAMNLDWPEAGSKSTTLPSFVAFQDGRVLPGRGNTAAMIIGGVALAIVFALAQQRYQRRVLAGYLQADALITRRNEELRAAQAELAHSQKMRALGTLAAGIAHDFNNLLSVIRMSNKLIKRAAANDPEVRENVAEIETAVQQGKSVVQSMLGYSRSESDRVGPVSLPEVVEDSVGLLSKQFLSGLTLKLELAEEAPCINGSRGQVEQILLNLVVNAAEAMKGQSHGELRLVVRPVAALPGRLVLSPRAGGPYVELLVADTGPGIPLETLPRVFDAFFTTKAVGVTQGAGLGLSTVYTIAERAGYGIAVDSTPGRGAAFHMFFPVSEASKEGAPHSHTDNRVGPA
jgi:signal transduction histidine kinase